MTDRDQDKTHESMTKPRDTPAWQALVDVLSNPAANPAGDGEVRATPAFSLVAACGISLDLSRQRLPKRALAALGELTTALDLGGKARALVAGRAINGTEQRAVRHTISRAPSGSATADARVIATLSALEAFTEAVRQGHKAGRSLADHRYTDVLVIGIGGSALGPQLAVTGLSRFADGPRIHFLSNIDGAAFDDVTNRLSPLTTLVLVISKTFTTEETTINAEAARVWLEAGAGSGAFPRQLVAITANPEEAQRRGYLPDATFSFDAGVGGRFSLWSAVGLPVALSIGFANFRTMLDGAYAMDQHFADAPFAQNLPMLLAAAGLWNRNFEGIAAHAILPYAERLSLLPKHLQQLEMESNGKSVDLDGSVIDYPTCPIIFGEAGTNGQHSFHQLLHQGTDIVSSDILIVREREGRSASQHQRLLAHAFAQADALWHGNRPEEMPAFRVHDGGRPVGLIELERLDPFHLGALIAMYEHKVFAQGVMWHVNSFDQWGVELGKTIAKNLLSEVAKASLSTPPDKAISQHFTATNNCATARR